MDRTESRSVESNISQSKLSLAWKLQIEKVESWDRFYNKKFNKESYAWVKEMLTSYSRPKIK